MKKRGNLRPGANRNTDTRAANLKRTELADGFARQIAKRLFDGSAAGSPRAMAEWLNAEDIPTRTGRPWTERAVRRLFLRLNPAYRKNSINTKAQRSGEGP